MANNLNRILCSRPSLIAPTTFDCWASLIIIIVNIIITTTITLIIITGPGVSAAAATTENDTVNKVEKTRSNFDLPKVFEFKNYINLYGKHYDSAVEFLLRQKCFLARVFRAFVSAVAYKHRRRSSYLAVNARSDWTLAELRASLQEPELPPSAGSEKNGLMSGDDDESNEEEETELEQAAQLVDVNQLGEQLETIRAHANETGYAQLAHELFSLTSDGQQLSRRKRTAALDSAPSSTTTTTTTTTGDNKIRDNFNVGAALMNRQTKFEESQVGGITVIKKVKTKSNNPNYEPPELMSMGVPGLRRTEKDFHRHHQYRPVYYRWPMADEQVSRDKAWLADGGKDQGEQPSLVDTSGQNFLQNVVGQFVSGMGGLFGGGGGRGGARSSGPAGDTLVPAHANEQLPPSEPDQVFVDHRTSGCLGPVREQGQCGSCYAFGTLAFLEWAHCRETKTLEQFSVQYVLDCGAMAGKTGLRGCRSGKITTMGKFVQNFGLELERNYPYEAREQQCPYAADTPFERMGYLRVRLNHVLRVPMKFMEHYLERSPMVVSMSVGEDFHEYGGGIDSGAHCGPVGVHTMLLIGHGRQDGREYWLIRNSYGPDFGEQGHYKLDKQTGSRCFEPDEGFIYGLEEHSVSGLPKLFASRNSKLAKPIKKLVATDGQTAAPVAASLVLPVVQDGGQLKRELEAAKKREEARKLSSS